MSKHRIPRLHVMSALVAAGLAAGCGGNDGSPAPAAPPETANTKILPSGASATAACNALVGNATSAGFPPGTQIVFAKLVAATATEPEHCQIKGVINGGRAGANGQTYAIKWHLRLPSEWNGRFYFSGGGGINGNLGDAKGGGAGGSSALVQRYAVVSTDSGHANGSDADFGAFDSVNFDAQLGPATFAFDPQARIDHGYRSYGLVSEAAKATLSRFYAQSAYYSYFQGCSEGGREALVMSQRFPELFDGIVSGNPGMDLPTASIAEVWDTQQLASAATSLGQVTASGDPWLNNAFTPAQMVAVGNAILQACDATDGAVDGMVLNPEACTTFDVASLGPTGSGVINTQQVTALQTIIAGAKDSSGKDLYAGWFWDPGIASNGWRVWKMGAHNGTAGAVNANTALNLSPFAGGSAIAYVWPTPPNKPTKNGQTVTLPWPAPDAFTKYVLGFDMDVDAPSFFASNATFQTSEYDLLYSSSTDYNKFSDRKGRLLVYTGGADPVFSARHHVDWYKRLATRYGGFTKTQQFARLFYVPGMAHCGGGVATDSFDAFKAVVNWVEKGSPPDSLAASARSANAAELGLLSTPVPATRQRPLCPYPKFAKYTGPAGGSIEDAANFACQ